MHHESIQVHVEMVLAEVIVLVFAVHKTHKTCNCHCATLLH